VHISWVAKMGKLQVQCSSASAATFAALVLVDSLEDVAEHSELIEEGKLGPSLPREEPGPAAQAGHSLSYCAIASNVIC
jgi:hypothetical protein